MSEVKRYDPVTSYIGSGEYTAQMDEFPDGSYVSLEDYERLTTENTQLTAQVAVMTRAIQEIAIEALRDEGCGGTADELENIIANLPAEAEKLVRLVEATTMRIEAEIELEKETDIGGSGYKHRIDAAILKRDRAKDDQMKAYRDLRGDK